MGVVNHSPGVLACGKQGTGQRVAVKPSVSQRAGGIQVAPTQAMLFHQFSIVFHAFPMFSYSVQGFPIFLYVSKSNNSITESKQNPILYNTLIFRSQTMISDV